MAESGDEIILRRRARRRLIGAIALVVLAVIVLPIVFDSEPRPIGQDLVIQIPSQDSGRFKTPVGPATAEPTAGAPTADSGAARTEPGAAGSATEGDATKGPAVKPPAGVAKPAPAVKSAAPAGEGAAGAERSAAAPSDEEKRAKAILEGESYAVPLGSFSQSDNVKQIRARAAPAGYRIYTESITVGGVKQLRVKAGPFSSREGAEKARENLKSMGLTVGAVTREKP